MGDNLIYAVRGNTGFQLKRGIGRDSSTILDQAKTTREASCEVFAYSHDGQYFAYCDRQTTTVIEVASGKVVIQTDLKRTKQIIFSPKDSVMLTFEQYAIYGQKTSEDQKPEPNVRVFRLCDGKHIATLISQRESSWAPQWSEDESLVARVNGGEIVFSSNNNFEKIDRKLVIPGLASFSLSSGPAPYNVATYVPTKGSEAAVIRVHKVADEFPVTHTRKIFKSDKAKLTWNSKGNALLILNTVEVDKSNQSYYGESHLYLINVRTNDSIMVPLSKEGPVYSAKWNPNGKEFAVCYGYMPAKVTFYSVKGIPIHETEEGPKNDVHYNAFGNIVLICGFGNLSKGKMEFWDVEKKKELISIDVPNTTLFEWAPDGQHFVTCTTAPRLRIENCYRFWNYSGKMLHEVTFDSPKEELWEVKFRPMRGYNTFQVRELSKIDKLSSGLPIKKKDASHPLNNLPAGAIKASKAYVPPHLRGKVAAAAPKGAANGGNSAKAAPPKPQMNEVERKIQTLKKKLDDVKKIKEKNATGQPLLPNQIEKMNKEQQFIEELEKLTLIGA